MKKTNSLFSLFVVTISLLFSTHISSSNKVVNDWVDLKTNVGTGADVQVNAGGNAGLNVGSRNRSATRYNTWNGGSYSTYLRFDLTGITGSLLVSKLKLTLNTTTTGSTFKVYGLNDGYIGGTDEGTDAELGEDWPEGTQDWVAAATGVINGDRAPGYVESTGNVNTSKVTYLGSLSLADGLAIGSTFEFSSDLLTDFINADTNDKITLILVHSGPSTTAFEIKTKEAGATNAPNLMYIVTSSDIVAPSVPANLSSSSVLSSSATVSWDASTDDNIGTAGYNVYVNGTKHNTNLIKTTSYSLTDLTANTNYAITVAAIDYAKNESTQSTATNFTTTTTTNINNLNENDIALIYYNSNKQIIVNCKGEIFKNANIAIYNNLGQIAQSDLISCTKSIIQTELMAGVYFVVVNNGGKKITQKIILN